MEIAGKRQQFAKKRGSEDDLQSPRQDCDVHATKRMKDIECGCCNKSRNSGIVYSDLPLEFWKRTPECKEAKFQHMEQVDKLCSSREDLVLMTTLFESDTALEPNMFPYDTPTGISHYTLWSVKDMTHREIITYVDQWLRENLPQVRRWQYDDNTGDRTFDLFHVHVFIETDPFSFKPTSGEEYFPPHMSKQFSESVDSSSSRDEDIYHDDSDCSNTSTGSGKSSSSNGTGDFWIAVDRCISEDDSSKYTGHSSIIDSERCSSSHDGKS